MMNKLFYILLLALPLYGQVYQGELGDSTAAIRSDLGGGGVSDHGALTGLGDDDHTQYMQDLVDDTTPQLGGNLDVNNQVITFPSHSIVDVLDEDDMSSNNPEVLATQQSIKAYVDFLKAQQDSALMIGSDNAAWIPCPFMGSFVADADAGYKTYLYLIRNTGETDNDLVFMCPLPTNRGGKKLYVKGIQFGLINADANDYVDRVYVSYYYYHSAPTIYEQTTNVTTTGDKVSGSGLDAWGSADDCSAGDYVSVLIETVCTTASDLDIGHVQLQCYYDD